MSDSIKNSIKSPALGDEAYRKNLSGMPRTLKIEQIQKETRPPKSSPRGILGRSVRV